MSVRDICINFDLALSSKRKQPGSGRLEFSHLRRKRPQPAYQNWLIKSHLTCNVQIRVVTLIGVTSGSPLPPPDTPSCRLAPKIYVSTELVSSAPAPFGRRCKGIRAPCPTCNALVVDFGRPGRMSAT